MSYYINIMQYVIQNYITIISIVCIYAYVYVYAQYQKSRCIISSVVMMLRIQIIVRHHHQIIISHQTSDLLGLYIHKLLSYADTSTQYYHTPSQLLIHTGCLAIIFIFIIIIDHRDAYFSTSIRTRIVVRSTM